MLGTPDFIAPEQITDAQGADIRADIYSLGCTLYYLLSGRPPFRAAKLNEVLRLHHGTDARLLNLVRPEVPAELAAVVAKMMAKEADRRYQTPIEVAKALVRFFTRRSAETVSPNPGTAPGDASVADRAAAEQTHVETQAVMAPVVAPAANERPAMVSTLDEFTQSGTKSAGVTDAAQPLGAQAPWLRRAVVGAAGLVTIVIVGTIMTAVRLRPNSDTPVEKVASTEPARELQIRTVEISPPSSVVSTHHQQATPSPHLPGEPPGPPPPLVVGPSPTPAPAPPTVAAGAEVAKRIETSPARQRTALGEKVEVAIRDGVRYLKGLQHPNGTWSDVENEAKTGTTSLITLALMTAGESLESPPIRKALEYLRGFGPNDLHSTYAISLQTMVFAAAEPERDKLRIANNVRWLERAQIKPGDTVTRPRSSLNGSPLWTMPLRWPGSWTYSDSKRGRNGDNSNTQFALLGLYAAREVGVAVDPMVWELSRQYWEGCQKRDGSWAYTPDTSNSTASMTCAGISGLIMTRLGSLRAPGQESTKKQSPVKPLKSGLGRLSVQGQEFLDGDTIRDCGKGGHDRNLQAGIDWLAKNFQVGQNFGHGQQWKFYYLYGLERTGRMAGVRFFGQNDWYRLGAEELVREQDKLGGFWAGALNESDKVLATTFAISFLAKGCVPVLVNKLSNGRDRDWDNDPVDVRNIVGVISRDWKTLLTWQVLDPGVATVSDLLQAPIAYFNGHHEPQFSVVCAPKSARIRRARRFHFR